MRIDIFGVYRVIYRADTIWPISSSLGIRPLRSSHRGAGINIINGRDSALVASVFPPHAVQFFHPLFTRMMAESAGVIQRFADSSKQSRASTDEEKISPQDMEVDRNESVEKVQPGQIYARLRPYLLTALGLVILGWWISSTILKNTRHRWFALPLCGLLRA